ncbi:hypothetical protein HW555_013043 [Spodoptera exigua]|uniref:Uncharacterized protein n=1 Tax=Spodoptera exigua TaxID=7107 RepID=A0A835L058_SPOEX|nr:hypothetical protein HW555_013043 [Spodoptera exigua]
MPAQHAAVERGGVPRGGHHLRLLLRGEGRALALQRHNLSLCTPPALSCEPHIRVLISTSSLLGYVVYQDPKLLFGGIDLLLSCSLPIVSDIIRGLAPRSSPHDIRFSIFGVVSKKRIVYIVPDSSEGSESVVPSGGQCGRAPSRSTEHDVTPHSRGADMPRISDAEASVNNRQGCVTAA